MIASTRSRMIANRRAGSVPWFRISSRFQPAPTPNSSRPPVSRSRLADLLRGHDRVALDHQADPGAELDPLGRRAGRHQGDERVVDVRVLARQLVAGRVGGLARGRDMGVVGEEQRLERALLDHPRQGRPDRCLVGGEVADRELHRRGPRPARAGGRPTAQRLRPPRRPAGPGRPRAGRCRRTRRAAAAKASAPGRSSRACPAHWRVDGSEPLLGTARAGSVIQVARRPRRCGFQTDASVPTAGPRSSRRRASSCSLVADPEPQRALEHAEALVLSRVRGASAAGCRRARSVASTTSRLGRRARRSHRLARGQLQRLGPVGLLSSARPGWRSLRAGRRSRWRSRATPSPASQPRLRAIEPGPVDDAEVVVVARRARRARG